jgi:hypothetical protein
VLKEKSSNTFVQRNLTAPGSIIYQLALVKILLKSSAIVGVNKSEKDKQRMQTSNYSEHLNTIIFQYSNGPLSAGTGHLKPRPS